MYTYCMSTLAIAFEYTMPNRSACEFILHIGYSHNLLSNDVEGIYI